MSYPARYTAPDFGTQVRLLTKDRPLVVQPRMGMASADGMAAGIRAVAALPCATAATITLDSYTRVGDHA